MKKYIYLIFLIVIGFSVLTIGITFGKFFTNIKEAETGESMILKGGKIQITYDGGPAITAPNMKPKETPFVTKNFTVTGNNVTNDKMEYNLILKMINNTFSFNALEYKLFSTNTGSNGTVVPAQTNSKGVGAGSREIILGTGHFTGTSGTDRVHTYKLELYYKTSTPSSNNVFEAKILIKEGKAPASVEYLNERIIASYGNITAAPTGTFNKPSESNENKLYKIDDNYGISYYYRGDKDAINNNLIFAEHQWKIIRINGDGSIRIIYNGKCPNNTCKIYDTGRNTHMEDIPFNDRPGNDNKYHGYMYSPSGTTVSKSREQAVTNVTNSTSKIYLDNWYIDNIKNKGYDSYISDTLFCNDRQLSHEAGGSESPDGYGAERAYYASYQRNYTKKTPTIMCALKNDRFTVSDKTIGNGNLTYPIGLITADEAAIAGLKNNEYVKTNFLYNNIINFTMSPAFYNGSRIQMWIIDSTGELIRMDGTRTIGVGLRAVLNLKASTIATGNGSISSPYKVV